MSSKTLSFHAQDFGFFGGGLQGSRMSRNVALDPSTPLGSRSSSMRKNGDDQVSPSEFSPGLLDLHSFDTELLPEVKLYLSSIFWSKVFDTFFFFFFLFLLPKM
jgi:kinesin family protein 2/24